MGLNRFLEAVSNLFSPTFLPPGFVVLLAPAFQGSGVITWATEVLTKFKLCVKIITCLPKFTFLFTFLANHFVDFYKLLKTQILFIWKYIYLM